MVEKSNCLKVGVIDINLANQFSKNPIIPTTTEFQPLDP